jgi:hypothetical protein
MQQKKERKSNPVKQNGSFKGGKINGNSKSYCKAYIKNDHDDVKKQTVNNNYFVWATIFHSNLLWIAVSAGRIPLVNNLCS